MWASLARVAPSLDPLCVQCHLDLLCDHFLGCRCDCPLPYMVSIFCSPKIYLIFLFIHGYIYSFGSLHVSAGTHGGRGVISSGTSVMCLQCVLGTKFKFFSYLLGIILRARCGQLVVRQIFSPEFTGLIPNTNLVALLFPADLMFSLATVGTVYTWYTVVYTDKTTLEIKPGSKFISLFKLKNSTKQRI